MTDPPTNFMKLLSLARDYRAGAVGMKATFQVLTEHMGLTEGGWSCFPGVALLAEETEQSQATVRRHLAVLESRGLIARTRRGATGNKGGRAPNLYTLDSHLLADLVSAQGARLVGGGNRANGGGVTAQTAGGNRANGEFAPLYRTTNNSKSNKENDRLSRDDVVLVFNAWRESTGRNGRTVLSDKRKKLIRSALEYYPLDDVLAAVRGWEHLAFNRGSNENATVYNELELLLRDPAHIERFRDAARRPREPDGGGRRSGGSHSKSERSMDVAQELFEEYQAADGVRR